MSLLENFLKFIYPTRCPCCCEVNETDTPCEKCAEDLIKCEVTGKVCNRCGQEIKNCQCRQYHYLFEGAAAPFYNRDKAQQGIYSLKFRFDPDAAKFYGSKMAKTFVLRFPKVKCDVVCIVPSRKEDINEYGYDKVRLLAKHCAKALNIPLRPKIISKVRKTERQHKLSADKQQANVKGAYEVKQQLDGKTVLLIDDIKTTGYTLNECAKQLRMAGADKVYCLTALISYEKLLVEKSASVF